MADAIKPAVALEAVLAGGGRGTGLRLARFFLGLWEQPATRDSMQGMLLSATTHPDLLRSFVVEQLLGRVSQVARQDAPQRRAALVGSQLVGLAVARYMVGVPSLADCPMETAARSIAATLDRYLRDKGGRMIGAASRKDRRLSWPSAQKAMSGRLCRRVASPLTTTAAG
jgi:hypothetical protein